MNVMTCFIARRETWMKTLQSYNNVQQCCVSPLIYTDT